MIVTIGGVKGGTGKTTLATNLTICSATSGREVLLIDGDEQQTALHFTALRNDMLGNAGYSCVRVTGTQMKTEAVRMASKFEMVIVDVGGWDNITQRGALLASDAVLFPFQPRTFDAWTLGRVQSLVSEAQMFNPKLKAYTVLSRADSRGSDNEDAASYLLEAEALSYLSTSVRNRKAFSNAARSGKGVIELREDPKAIFEIQALYDALFNSEIESPLLSVASTSS